MIAKNAEKAVVKKVGKKFDLLINIK
jgi:hypothetical protein